LYRATEGLISEEFLGKLYMEFRMNLRQRRKNLWQVVENSGVILA